jgi:hypothetical protein
VDSRTAHVSLREITEANRCAVERLAVSPDQEHYVAGIAESLVEAAAAPAACPWYRAVYARSEPAGFVMISDGIPDGYGPASPIGFYLRSGFSRTGQVFDGEEVLELPLNERFARQV